MTITARIYVHTSSPEAYGNGGGARKFGCKVTNEDRELANPYNFDSVAEAEEWLEEKFPEAEVSYSKEAEEARSVDTGLV